MSLREGLEPVLADANVFRDTYGEVGLVHNVLKMGTKGPGELTA